METYKIKVTETYVYNIEIEANDEKDALIKAKIAYKNNDSEFDGVFCADTTSFENVKFKILKGE